MLAIHAEFSIVPWQQWFLLPCQYAQVYSNLKLRITALCTLLVFPLFFLLFLAHMLKHISIGQALSVHIQVHEKQSITSVQIPVQLRTHQFFEWIQLLPSHMKKVHATQLFFQQVSKLFCHQTTSVCPTQSATLLTAQ